MQELSLVTGGAGFIGSHLVEALTALGRPVRVFDDFSTGMRKNLEKAGAAEIVTGDVADPAAVEGAMHGVKVVYHLAALASVARSVETPAVTHRACCTGTLHVLDAARKAGVRRLVFAASSSAYGGASIADGQKEDAPMRPLSPYAAAKLAGELYLKAFAHTYGIETVSLRFFNIFGPRQRADSPYSGVIALFTAAMAAGKRPGVHGDGLQSRDFTFVSNAVQALMKAAEAKGVSGNVYNVGTGSSITVLDLIAALNKLLGTDLKPLFAPPRAGDVRFSRADISRTRRDLGYNPDVPFLDGLGRTLQWYRDVQTATRAA
ncbi:MAG TPA: NAD-dependent epimerase/dehydratase family protein [Gemmataceae bacterium]|nr:NAD-dependent epimerase/dehydratase family protein [Gemmataceae bacterium]